MTVHPTSRHNSAEAGRASSVPGPSGRTDMKSCSQVNRFGSLARMPNLQMAFTPDQRPRPYRKPQKIAQTGFDLDMATTKFQGKCRTYTTMRFSARKPASQELPAAMPLECFRTKCQGVPDSDSSNKSLCMACSMAVPEQMGFLQK